VASSADSCVCHSDGHVKIVTGIFVDDGISCSIDESKLTDMLQYVRKQFEVRKELATTPLGLTCSTIATPAQSFHQLATIHNWCYPTSWFAKLQSGHNSGEDPNIHLIVATEEDAPISAPHKEAIGCLTHAMTLTRPDIALCCELAAQFTERPTQVHWVAAKRILRYLHGTKDCGIM